MSKEENDEFIDIDELEKEENKESKEPKEDKSKGKSRESKGSVNNSKDHEYEDGYLMGDSQETKDDFDSYLRSLEEESGFKDFKKHEDEHGTLEDTGENFRRNYYSEEENSRHKGIDDIDDDITFINDARNIGDIYKGNPEKDYKDIDKDKSYSLNKEVEKYGGRGVTSKTGGELYDKVLGDKTQTGNKSVDKSLEALRKAIEYDIDKAVENDKNKIQHKIGRMPTERDFKRIEDKHRKKKSEGLREKVTSGIKTARTKENREKFKAFMESAEVKTALKLIGFYGGVFGKGFVIGVNIFTAIWTMNFGVLFVLFASIVAIMGFILVSGVFVVVMTLSDGEYETEEVEVGEGVSASSVEVPPGYEGKFMYPVEKTRRSSRGYTGVGGHLGQDISGAGENIYPIYPGKVILSGIDAPQCHNYGADAKCSTIRNDSAGITFRGDGNAVQIAHDMGDGKYMISYYMHMAPGSIKVKEGDEVGYGTPIGSVGNSGNSYGAHLHVEIYDNVDKEFYTKGKSHYKTDYNWYYKLINMTIAPPPLWTCGGENGVAINSAGLTNTPQSCVDDAVKARGL